MYKNKVFLSLIFVAIIAVLFLVLSRNQEVLTATKNQIEPKAKVSSAIQKTAIVEQKAKKVIAKIPELPKEDLEPPTLDAEIESLSSDAVEGISKSANYILDNPVHLGRAKLQQQMRMETAEETFVNLTDNDNFAMLMPVMSGRPFSPGAYESDVMIVSKMTRVRKLLEDAKDNPGQVAGFLEQQIKSLMAEYPSQYKEYLQSRKDGSNFSRELPEYKKTTILCTAAVYILSQIGTSDSLSTLAWLAGQSNADKDNSLPVNRKFLFYAMHSIVQKTPRLDTSGQYMKRVKKYNIPDAKSTKVTTWDAHFHEDDFRGMLRGKKIDLETQPTIELELFPVLSQFGSGKVESLLKELIALR